MNQQYRFDAVDTLTVSSGVQMVGITAKNSQNSYPIWYLSYYNSSCFLFNVWFNSSYFQQGIGYCTNGVVSVVAEGTSISFIGNSLQTVNGATFTQLNQIVTTNDDGSFNSGKIDYTITAL
jgi:hypothetical protein